MTKGTLSPVEKERFTRLEKFTEKLSDAIEKGTKFEFSKIAKECNLTWNTGSGAIKSVLVEKLKFITEVQTHHYVWTTKAPKGMEAFNKKTWDGIEEYNHDYVIERKKKIAKQNGTVETRTITTNYGELEVLIIKRGLKLLAAHEDELPSVRTMAEELLKEM